MTHFSKLEFLQKCIVAIGVVACFTSTSARAELGQQLFKLTPSDVAAEDGFGLRVAISGNTAIVGAPFANNTGAAYLFDVTTGQELFKFEHTDPDGGGGSFGWSVSISGNIAIVGNPGDFFGFGAAYLFDVTTGEQLFKLTPPYTGNDFVEFGNSVAISGNTAIISAKDHIAGAAYLFDVITGDQLFKLTASDAAAHDQFGYSVAISGDTALVGSVKEKAYLFDVTTGEELFKLTTSTGVRSVAIDGNIAIVGTPSDDDAGSFAGAAYLFDVTTGEELFKLTASDAAASDSFGFSVAISGDIAIVGAFRTHGSGSSFGSAYFFDVTTGQELAKVTASDPAALENFGLSVAISGNTALVGSVLNANVSIESGAAYVFAVPEPAGIGLLALSAAVLLPVTRRRRMGWQKSFRAASRER